MSYELNRKIRDLKPYDPISGDYKIRLDANESFFNIPDDLKKEVTERISQLAFNRYPDPMAKDVCRKFAEYYGVDPAYVTAYNGSDETISVIMTSFLMRGDTVITLSNEFSMYRFYASLAEAKSVEVPKREDLTIDVDLLIETANKEKAAMIIFSNPCNPTSLGLEKDDVLRLIRSVDALVVLDEAYMDFWDQSLIQQAAGFDNLILLRTCSKAFGMAGIRLGFSVANQKLTNAMRAVKSPYNSNSITQEIGSIVYEHRDLMMQRTNKVIDSRKALQEMLRAIQDEFPNAFSMAESCTNFVYLKTDQAEEIYRFLLENSIAVRFFKTGHLRITAGMDDENKTLVDTLWQYFTSKNCG